MLDIPAHLEKYITRCFYCGEPVPALAVSKDHFFPYCKMGGGGINLVRTCRPCNVRKAGRMPTVEEMCAFLKRHPHAIPTSFIRAAAFPSQEEMRAWALCDVANLMAEARELNAVEEILENKTWGDRLVERLVVDWNQAAKDGTLPKVP